MSTGLRGCNSREPRSAQAIEAASQDTSILPPWLKNAQDSAVVVMLRRNLEARSDKPYLGNNAGSVTSLFRDTSEGPEAGSTAKRHACCMKATERTKDGLPAIDTKDINDPIMGKSEIVTHAEQAEKEGDLLRMELSKVKGQLGNAERAVAKLAEELLTSRSQLKAASVVELQLSMQVDVLANELEVSAIAAENAAKRAEADLATVHTELEVVKSERAGKISELNEMKPQLDFARFQLRTFLETYASNCGQLKMAEMQDQQADEELTLVKAEFGAMNNRDVGQPTESVLADPGQLAGLNKKHLQADQISEMETELESAPNAQVMLQDVWTQLQYGSELTIAASSLVAASSNQPVRNGDTCVWEVSYRSGVSIRVAKSLKAAIIGRKDAGMVVCGRQERGWVALTEEPGFMKILESGRN